MLQISIGLGQPGPSDPKSWSLFKQTKQKTAEALTEVYKIIQNNSVKKMSVPLVNLKGQVVQVLDKTKHRNSTNSTSNIHCLLLPPLPPRRPLSSLRRSPSPLNIPSMLIWPLPPNNRISFFRG